MSAQLVVAFHRRHPQVRVIVNDPVDDRGAIDALRSGRTDIAIVHAGAEPADLPAVRAGEQEFVAVFPSDLAPQNETVTLAEVAGRPLVAPISGSSARSRHDSFFRTSGDRLLIAAECNDHSAKIELVRSGVGVTLTTATAAAHLPADGLAFRPIYPPVRVSLIAVRRSHCSPAAEAFCRDLQDR